MAEELKKDAGEKQQDVGQAQIEQWKARYGKVYALEGEELTVYCRKPGRAEMARFAKELQRDLYRASWNLLVACRLHPDVAVLQQISEEKPGVILSLAGELAELSGANTAFLSRVL